MDRSKWEYKKLGDIAIVSAGQGAPQGDSNYSPVGTPFVKAGNIESLVKGLSEYEIQKVNDEVAKSHRLKIYKAGSVLFAKSGMSCMKGLVYTLKNDCYVVSHLAIVTPKNVDSHYLNYFFQVNKPNSLIKDSAYPSISLKDIEKMIVLYPPLADQQRIVAELDCLKEMIAMKQEQLKEFDKLAQSIFYDMFGDPVANEKGWEKNKLDELYKVTSSKRILQSEWQDNGVPFYKVADIVNLIGGMAVVPSTFIKESTYNEFMRQGLVPDSGDILITSRGTLGECYIVLDGDKFYFQDGMITWLSQKANSILPIYLKSVFGTKSFLDSLIHNANMSTVAYLSIGQLSKVKIPLPPRALQQQFADKISAIEAQKELVKQSIAETQHLLDYTMDKYFGYD